MRALRIAAFAELVTLVLLLANMITLNWHPVAALLGPVHGCAYLFVIIATLRNPLASNGMRLLAWLPGVGGLLVERQLTAHAGPSD